MSSNVTPFPGTRVAPPASVGALLAAPLSAYRLTVENDPPRVHRLRLALAASIGALIAFLAAWHDVTARSTGSLLPLGFGRLADMAERHGWSLAWVISTVEMAHYGVLCCLFALTVWFGATRRPIPLPNEMLIFHRRQSPWICGVPILGAVLGLAMGQWLVSQELPLLAVPLEVVGVSLLGGGLWQCLVPEARMSLSVILDAKAGWANRLVLSGGLLRYLSRVTILKDDLKNAEARDIGGVEFLFGARSLDLRLLGASGDIHRLRIRGIAPDPEIGVLANILSTRFKLGVTRETLDRAQAISRWPVELNDILNGQL